MVIIRNLSDETRNKGTPYEHRPIEPPYNMFHVVTWKRFLYKRFLNGFNRVLCKYTDFWIDLE
jgi:hypothetical protein